MKHLFLFTFLFFSYSLFSQKVESKSYNRMLKVILTNKVQVVSVSDIPLENDYIFIDSREKKEFDVSHIKNAIWCGYEDFDIARLKSVPKDKKIIVYCSVGYRSEKITSKLTKAGFSDASNLYGGIFEWKNAGRKVVDNSNKETEKVHAFDKKWGKWLTKGEKVY